MIGETVGVIALLGGPVLGGIIWARMVKAVMLDSGWSIVRSYLLGAVVSLVVPFALVSAMASGANRGSGASGLLYLSSYICAFLALIAFIFTFAAITGDKSNEE
jgi:hypothetical protein